MFNADQPTKHILIVEDSTVVRGMMTQIIETEGYTVASAKSAEEALEYLRSAPKPQLILLDLVLPYMRSDEFLRELQNDRDLAVIPVAIISGYAQETPYRIPFTVAYLEKPIDFEQLMDVVRTYCY